MSVRVRSNNSTNARMPITAINALKEKLEPKELTS